MSSGPRPKVGVMDSGVGGLSILEAVRRAVPSAAYHYLSDNEHFPYGTKTDDQVIDLTFRAVSRLVTRFALDMVVVACNTASTVALPRLRAHLTVPVIGVVPAIKPAAQLSGTGTIALLATPGTIRRAYTDELINSFASHCRVIKIGSSALVELAELKLKSERVDLDRVRAEIAPMFAAGPQTLDARLDTVVLGCTHFPLLVSELEAVAPWQVRWIDSGGAIAARTVHLLKELGFSGELSNPAREPMHFSCTRLDDGISALTPALQARGFERIEQL